MPQSMLIPLDGSTTAETILPHVLAFCQETPMTYVLLRVVEPVQVARHMPANPAVRELDNQLIDQLIVDAQHYLEQVAARLNRQAATVQVRVVVAPYAADAIIEQAQQDAVDLIAMATHARHGLSRVLLGSVAETVLRNASVPVLLFHPPADRATPPAEQVAAVQGA